MRSQTKMTSRNGFDFFEIAEISEVMKESENNYLIGMYEIKCIAIINMIIHSFKL